MLMVFNTDGSVEFTRNPSLLAIAPAGRLAVQRMTEIFFEESGQHWYIKFLTGPFHGLRLRWEDEALVHFDLGAERELHTHWTAFWHDEGRALVSRCTLWGVQEGIVYFNSYEEAVEVEVAFVDYLRKQGISMA